MYAPAVDDDFLGEVRDAGWDNRVLACDERYTRAQAGISSANACHTSDCVRELPHGIGRRNYRMRMGYTTDYIERLPPTMLEVTCCGVIDSYLRKTR